MQEMEIEFANLDAYGVAGANERAAEAEQAYAAGRVAVAGLADLAPGPELASALTEMAGFALDQKSRILLVGQWERQRSWTDAQAMAALAAAMGDPGEHDRHVIADVACTLHLSELSVGTKVALTRQVGAGLDGTWEALNAGLITGSHLWVLANVTRDAAAEVCTEVEEQVLPPALARGWTPAQLGDAARMALLKSDPEDAERRAREAKRTRSDVTFRSDEDMMAALVARTDAWTARQAMDEINRRADAMRRAGDPRSIGELRAAVFAAAFLGADPDTGLPARFTDAGEDIDPDADPVSGDDPASNGSAAASPVRRTPKRASALLLITLPTLLGGNAPGYLDGYGPITAAMARKIAASDIRFRRLLLDPATGKPRDLGDDSYELKPKTRRWIEARDRCCRFPGCRRRAVYCDVDHAVEWPLGKTTCANCGLACRRHHNLKTSKLWRLTRHADDSVHWHGPNGFDYHVDPATYEEFLDPPDWDLDMDDLVEHELDTS